MGRAVSVLFATEGASVVVADIDEGGAKETASMIAETGGAALHAVTDVSDPESVEAAVAAAVEHFGGLDVAVNAAAIEFETVPLHELDVRDYGNTDNRGGKLAVHTWEPVDYADGMVRVGVQSARGVLYRCSATRSRAVNPCRYSSVLLA